jgi:hypothetical protein
MGRVAAPAHSRPRRGHARLRPGAAQVGAEVAAVARPEARLGQARSFAAERATVAEPTAAEIPREWVRAVERDERAVETLTDRLAGLDAWVRVTLAAALPLVEARLREQIAADSDSMVEASVECPSCGASIRAHVALDGD